MEDTTCTNAPAATSCSPSNVFERDANPRQEQMFPLSDEEFLELAVMIRLVAGVGSSGRAHGAGVDGRGGA